MSADELRQQVLEMKIQDLQNQLGQAKGLVGALLQIVESDYSADSIPEGEATTVKVARSFVA